MNLVILLGKLTRDPELKTARTGNSYIKFSLAIDRGYSKERREEEERAGNPTADFINVTAFGKMAENVAKFCQKGSNLAVEGRIQTGWYEKNGEKVYTTDILANRVEFIFGSSRRGKKKSDSDNAEIDTDDFNPTENDIPF